MTALAPDVVGAPASATPAGASAGMPLSSHLREARTRSLRAAAALLIGVMIGYFLSDQVMEIVRAPITALAASRDASLNHDSITGAFDLKLRIALFSGIALSSPIWMYELLAIVTPAADVLSMFLIAVPMTALFLVALLIAWLHDRAADRRLSTEG